MQGFLKWPSDTTKWPASSSEASTACSAAAASPGASSADNALPPSMFFVDLSLGPSGVALLSQLVCARVELMLTRAAVLRDRGLLPEVPRVCTQSVIVCISDRSLPSFLFRNFGLCLFAFVADPAVGAARANAGPARGSPRSIILKLSCFMFHRIFF